MLPTAAADAPSFTTDDAAGSQASSTGRQTIGAGHTQASLPPAQGLPKIPLDAHIDDVEDSMHEDVLHRTAIRRQGQPVSKQIIPKKSTLEVVPRSTLPNQLQQSSPSVSNAPSIALSANKTKHTPTATGHEDRSDALLPQRQLAVTAPQQRAKSTPAPLEKQGSSTKKRVRTKSSNSISRKPACESCRKGKVSTASLI